MSAPPTTRTPAHVFEQPCAEMADHYAEHGFVLLDQAISSAEVAALNADAVKLCRGDFGEIKKSATEPMAVPADASDAEILRQFLCIHFPHKVSAIAKAALHAPRIVQTLTTVIGPNVKAMQSMLFIKSEGKPGQPWHQDEYFIPTRDRSLTGVWIALDDATVENGCLWVLPGSHRPGVIYPARDQNDPRFDCSIEAYDFPYSDDDAIPVEVPAGTAVIFNGYLVHRSLQHSGKHGYRRALANHYMSAESLLPWFPPSHGEHMGITDFRDIVLVAGTDPYAYKGTEDVTKPYSRADKDGGCDR